MTYMIPVFEYTVELRRDLNPATLSTKAKIIEAPVDFTWRGIVRRAKKKLKLTGERGFQIKHPAGVVIYLKSRKQFLFITPIE